MADMPNASTSRLEQVLRKLMPQDPTSRRAAFRAAFELAMRQQNAAPQAPAAEEDS